MRLAEWLIKYLQVIIGFYSHINPTERELIDVQTRNLPNSHPNWKLLEHNKCGGSNTKRIVGGEMAELGQYPWIAYIGYLFNGQIIYMCNGVLISKYYILTAAHCIFNNTEEINNVKLGEYDTRTAIDCQDGKCAPPLQIHEIEESIISPLYDPQFKKNDIGIIRLKTPVTFNDYVSPICLPYGRLLTEDFVGKIAEVAGWGIFNINAPMLSPTLLYVKLELLPIENCQIEFRRFNIGSGQLCAGGLDHKDACKGDSGSPLIIPESLDGSAPRYFLAGLTSYGPEQCGFCIICPSIYTDVRPHMDFVLMNLRP